MSPPPEPVTARLEARLPDASALQDLFELLRDPAVAAALWPGTLGGARTREQVRALIAADAHHWRMTGFGPWLWRDRDTQALVAKGGLGSLWLADSEVVQLAYVVAGDRWGQGIATEIAGASVATGFQSWGFRALRAVVAPDNLASQRVLEKVGFQRRDEARHRGLRHLLYGLERAQWARAGRKIK